MLSYPLHAAGKADQPRSGHFSALRVPVLFVSGTRDAMAGRTELTKAAKAIKAEVSWHWIDSADHGYRPLKSSGRTLDDVLAEVAASTATWVADLPG
jgi:predicted alpha/beta-hydrolase family hydrolase